MLIHKKGDILNATESIICHQVNVGGIMGGGLAKQIATTYPNVEKGYMSYCERYNKDYELLKGTYILVNVKCNQFIANCFTQKPNFETDYQALRRCFGNLLAMCKGHNATICVPYKYGCGIAKGNWNTVENIFNELSDEYKVDILVYEL